MLLVFVRSPAKEIIPFSANFETPFSIAPFTLFDTWVFTTATSMPNQQVWFFDEMKKLFRLTRNTVTKVLVFDTLQNNGWVLAPEYTLSPENRQKVEALFTTYQPDKLDEQAQRQLLKAKSTALEKLPVSRQTDRSASFTQDLSTRYWELFETGFLALKIPTDEKKPDGTKKEVPLSATVLPAVRPIFLELIEQCSPTNEIFNVLSQVLTGDFSPQSTETEASKLPQESEKQQAASTLQKTLFLPMIIDQSLHFGKNLEPRPTYLQICTAYRSAILAVMAEIDAEQAKTVEASLTPFPDTFKVPLRLLNEPIIADKSSRDAQYLTPLIILFNSPHVSPRSSQNRDILDRAMLSLPDFSALTLTQFEQTLLGLQKRDLAVQEMSDTLSAAFPTLYTGPDEHLISGLQQLLECTRSLMRGANLESLLHILQDFPIWNENQCRFLLRQIKALLPQDGLMPPQALEAFQSMRRIIKPEQAILLAEEAFLSHAAQDKNGWDLCLLIVALRDQAPLILTGPVEMRKILDIFSTASLFEIFLQVITRHLRALFPRPLVLYKFLPTLNPTQISLLLNHYQEACGDYMAPYNEKQFKALVAPLNEAQISIVLAYFRPALEETFFSTIFPKYSGLANFLCTNLTFSQITAILTIVMQFNTWNTHKNNIFLSFFNHSHTERRAFFFDFFKDSLPMLIESPSALSWLLVYLTPMQREQALNALKDVFHTWVPSGSLNTLFARLSREEIKDIVRAIKKHLTHPSDWQPVLLSEHPFPRELIVETLEEESAFFSSRESPTLSLPLYNTFSEARKPPELNKEGVP